MKQLWCVSTLTLFAALGSVAAEPEAQEAQDDKARQWSVGPVRVKGLIDGYYSLNLNHPESRQNQLRNFDVNANQFSLNMAELVLQHDPEPLGFRVDLGFGRAFDVIHATEPAPDVFRNILQAYVSYKPSKKSDFQVDFGKFVTGAGAEVAETHLNWNYSRSLLFALAIPYYHFGARATVPLHHHFTAGAMIVNGWNNVEDNNSGKTVGVTGTFHSPWFTWTNNYYVGPERLGVDHGCRHLYDTTLLLNPSAKVAFYVNFDYGAEKNPAGNSRWLGVAGAARLALSDRFAVTPRIEWFHDADGFATGTAQRLKEFTLTGEYKVASGVLTRLEYRRDWSDQPFFDRGSTPATFRNQDTVLIGFVAFFGPER